MEKKVLQFCQEKKLFEPGDRVVVAVSGGQDSMCLVHVLHKLGPNLDISLVVAHVNHQLRGQESEADARLVEDWARQAGLPYAVERIRIPKGSLQMRARELRYQALKTICWQYNCNRIATAHHADDQVETFLLNLLRGSGGRGLVGIQPRRFLTDKFQLVRPLLEIRQSEIKIFCRQNSIPWRLDASNSDSKYKRNSIRHRLIPLLREYNPSLEQTVLATIQHLALDQQLLDGMTAKALKEVVVPSPLPFAPTALSVSGLEKLDDSLARRSVRTLLDQQNLRAPIEAKHIEAVLSMAKAQTGSSLDLPGSCRVYRLYDSIALGGQPAKAPRVSQKLSIPGQAVLPGLGIIVTASLTPDSEAARLWLDQDAEALEVGNRRPGDWLNPGGGRKKLKEWLIDKKIPRWLRDWLPVIRCSGRVCLVPGLVTDLLCRASGPKKRAVYIRSNTINKLEEELD